MAKCLGRTAKNEPKILSANVYATSCGGKVKVLSYPVEFMSIPISLQDGHRNNVGNPLSKDYLSKIEDATLSSAAGSDAMRVLQLSKICSYWKNNRDRIM